MKFGQSLSYISTFLSFLFLAGSFNYDSISRNSLPKSCCVQLPSKILVIMVFSQGFLEAV